MGSLVCYYGSVHGSMVDREPSDIICPVMMTDDAARLLQLQFLKESLDKTHRAVFQNAYDYFISRHAQHAWASGQLVTERPGGNVVLQRATVATYAPHGNGELSLEGVKEGTKVLQTVKFELRGTRGWLIGAEDKGI